ncbi:MAG: hypothetical protein WBR10_09270, partial [Candidatus Acidiferrum sp.]
NHAREGRVLDLMVPSGGISVVAQKHGCFPLGFVVSYNEIQFHIRVSRILSAMPRPSSGNLFEPTSEAAGRFQLVRNLEP